MGISFLHIGSGKIVLVGDKSANFHPQLTGFLPFSAHTFAQNYVFTRMHFMTSDYEKGQERKVRPLILFGD